MAQNDNENELDVQLREAVEAHKMLHRVPIIANSSGVLRWLAWALQHSAHGPCIDTLCFLPEGDEPDAPGDWVRLPWLDQPPTLTPSRSDG